VDDRMNSVKLNCFPESMRQTVIYHVMQVKQKIPKTLGSNMCEMLIKSKEKNPVLWKAHARTLSKPRALQMNPITRLKLCPMARPKLTS
jgi:hypothetical protein